MPKPTIRPLPLRAFAARALAGSIAVSRATLTGLERRLAAYRLDGRDSPAAEYESMLAREAVRRYLPDVALYVMSALLACAVGVSIALYLN